MSKVLVRQFLCHYVLTEITVIECDEKYINPVDNKDHDIVRYSVVPESDHMAIRSP